MKWLRECALGALDLWYPAHCEGCGHPVSSGESFCPACAARLPWIREPRCRRCSFPFDGEMGDQPEFECHDCREKRFHFVCCVAAFRLRDPIRKMILDFKYHRQLRMAAPLGRALAEVLVRDSRLERVRIDGLVPAPLHPVRWRERGYNQAELIAEEISKALGIPVLNVLQRTRYTSTQTARDRKERMENLKGAFQRLPGKSLKGMHLVIVDDVFTTGSTIEACAKELRKTGVERLFGATIARG